MKKIIALSAALAVISISVFEQCSPSPDTNTVTTDSLPPVIAPDSWFTGPTTPAPDDYGQFLNPNVSDTSFHFWAWQKFLSYTRSASGKAPFESLVQVDNFLNPLGDTIALGDSSQAGTHGVLYAKNKEAIYYTVHVNQQMYDFQMQNLAIFRDTLNKYRGKPGQDSLVQQALNAGGYDTLTYPVGCVEVKTSWILVSSLSDPGNYYVTTANVTTAAGTSVQQVAMLGMHIVGRVANHPEFIWATYEHTGLAPDFPWANTAVQDTINTVPSQLDFLFYNGGTTVANCPMNNNAHSPDSFTNVFNMFPLGIARSFRSDSIPSTRDSSNNANTASLNQSVNARLQTVSGPWKNYFYKGSVWLTVPNPVFMPGQGYLGNLNDNYLRGSRAISNITMETFAQLEFSGNYQTGSMNCFGCHGTVDYTNVVANSNDSLSYNLALSHLFKNALGVQVADVSKDTCRNCNVIPRKR